MFSMQSMSYCPHSYSVNYLNHGLRSGLIIINNEAVNVMIVKLNPKFNIFNP